MTDETRSVPMSRLEVRYGLSWRALLAIVVPLVVLFAAGVWLAMQFLQPFPPRHVVFAAGPEHGALYAFAERYRAILARDDVKLEVKVTRGVGDNLALLRDASANVDAGFLVAGMAGEPDARGLVNLANVAYAPLWVLYRNGDEVTDLIGFHGRRIAVGEPGSGVATVVGPFLAANGITASTSRLVALPFDEALSALLNGEVDVAFLGEGPQHPAFVDALARPDIRLMDFARADAYARRLTWLRALRLPAATLDFERNLPPRDVRLIGSTVMIAARDTLHPTIVDLLVDAAREVHGGNGFFEARGEFPDLHAVDAIPMSEQAVRYAQSGPSMLRRYLPLWLADFLQRIFMLSLPVLLIALPALRWIPSGVGALISNRIKEEYASLRVIERQIAADEGDPAVLQAELERVESRAASMRVPATFVPQLFQLRTHIRLVKQLLADRAGRH
jgi:TRAP-type uncharacterized transport system substrate-binding protein